jgi:glycosyltransferase involved in cell wall biosynthesis
MLFSIITINHNNSKGLLNTILSINNQNYKFFEHIIIDGNSTDASLEVLRKINNENIIWISENDRGIYHAMNKGILMSKGKYLIFINSGDFFSNNNCLDLINEKKQDFDIVYSNMIIQNDTTSTVIKYQDPISTQLLLTSGIPHPGTAIKRELFNVVGLYNEKYKIISDWIFFFTAIVKHNASHIHINEPLVIFDTGGISSNKKNIASIIIEHRDFLKNNFPEFLNYFNNNSVQIKRYLKNISRWKRPFYKLFNIVIVK